MIGRDAELAALGRVVRDRRPALALVEGEAGVGKSVVVRALAEGVRDELTVLVGHCRRLREPFWLGAVLEALPGARDALVDVDLSPVAGVLRAAVPELAGVLPAAPVEDPRFGCHVLFRAVREVLAATGPTLLVVEDLHLADEGTREMVRFLAGDPPPDLAVVATYRRADVTGGMPLGAAFRPGSGVATEIVRLAPLTVGQVRALASAVLGTDMIGPGFAAALHERTAGLPFAVEEVLRSVDRRDVRLPDEVEVPVLVREAVVERLAALSPDACRFVRAASAFTTPTAAEPIGFVADLTGARLGTAVDEAVRAAVLHHRADDDTYAFRHPLARQAVYDTVGVMRRRELHARAVLLDDLPLVERARHSRLAGHRDEWARYAEAAADQAMAAGDARTAAQLLRQLLEQPALSGADVDRLGAKLGEASQPGVDGPGSVAVLERLLTDHRLSSAAKGEIRMQLGLLLLRRADAVAEGRAQLALAVDDLADRPDLVARCTSALGQPFHGDVPLSRVTPWLRKADSAAARCEDPELRISLLANVVGSLVAIGDPDARDRVVPDAVRGPGERRQLARAHCNLADALTTVGRFDEARERLRSGMKAAEDSGAPYVLSTALSTAVRLDWFTGAWDGLAERARGLLAEHHDLVAVAGELNLVLGLLALVRGAWADAEEHLLATGVRTPRDAVASVALGGSAGLIRLALANDDVPRAAREADAGMELLRRKEVWAWAGDLAPAAVDAYLAAGRLRDASEVTREVQDATAGLMAPLAIAAAHTCRGAVSEAGGAAHHATAARAYERIGAPYLAATAWERVARHLVADGGPKAAEAWTRCAERYEALGATHDAARCRHLLRGMGVAMPSRQGRRGYGEALSPREREVARLLAAGRTNNQIAEALYLSPRTVEQHASKVLRKLKVASRRDIRAADL